MLDPYRYDRGSGSGSKKSLMSMLGDGYMDANVAANEKQVCSYRKTCFMIPQV